MKKQYTKKFILEALAYWKKQLRMMNESIEDADAVDEAAEEAVNAFIEQLNLGTFYRLDDVVAMYPLHYKLNPSIFSQDLCDSLYNIATSNNDAFFIVRKSIPFKKSSIASVERIFFIYAQTDRNGKYSLQSYEVFKSYKELNAYLADVEECIYNVKHDL